LGTATGEDLLHEAGAVVGNAESAPILRREGFQSELRASRVRNLHPASTQFPLAVLAEVSQIPGMAQVPRAIVESVDMEVEIAGIRNRVSTGIGASTADNDDRRVVPVERNGSAVVQVLTLV
jgi:hypothetical protein